MDSSNAIFHTFPGLQVVEQIWLQIVDIVNTLGANREDCVDIVVRIAQIIQPLCEAFSSRISEDLKIQLKNDLERFVGDLVIIKDTMEGASRNSNAVRNSEVLRWCKGMVDQSFERFQIYHAMTSSMDAAQLDPHEMPYTSYTIGAAGQVNNVHRDQYIVCEAHPVHGQLVATSPGLIAENTLKVMNIGHNSASDKLPYADGASWNFMLVCLPGTRVELLEYVCEWIHTIGSQRILWLKGIAGCGKSAFAHTVAQGFDTTRLLGSSFFCDRNTFHRNTLRRLFSTVALDLARLHPAFAQDIAAVLEEDPSLASASLSRQFANLILGPLVRHPLDRPTIIVIDAIDEISEDGFYIELLAILRDEVHKLPQTIRIFLTSRPSSILDQFLEGRAHVVSRTIDIHSAENRQDIAVYIRSRLLEISPGTEMNVAWPNYVLFDDFQRAAEGLFIWVSTMCNYLRTTHDPEGELKSLISKSSPQGLLPAEKMDKLYTEILNTCNWRDIAFVGDYGIVMGAIMGAKRPLSIAAWESMHRRSLNQPVKRLLSGLSSLLAGTTNTSQPVCILHQSFREFITHRAREHVDTMHFYVSEQEHNQRLALLCVSTMNQKLAIDTIDTGYLGQPEDEVPGIPNAPRISEQLRYCCEHWTAHLSGVVSPVADALRDQISEFVSTRLVRWMEVVTSTGYFQGSVGVCDWLQTTAPEIIGWHDTEIQAASLVLLSCRLSYNSDRREEALTAIKEAVALYRILAEQRPGTLNPYLSISLNQLALRLSNLGRHGEALVAIQEAVELRRTLAAARPETFNPNLATSFCHLSSRFYNLGRGEEALTAAQEALDLYQHLAAESPVKFDPSFAMSRHIFSDRLSDLGRREEALMAIQEAVELHRKLAVQEPAIFGPDLAMSLSKFSLRLSDLGRGEEALAAIQETVALRRKLAAERPAKFNPDLAQSLNDLSSHLSHLGRREEALMVIEEAVGLCRVLVVEQSATLNPHLASSLNTLSLCLSDLGRRAEALTAVQEAFELRQKLAAERPTFNPDLAESLENLFIRLAEVGRREEALTAIQGALKLRRKLAAEQPAIFNLSLAGLLDNLSNLLAALNRPEESLTVIKEATELYRNIAAESPATFNPDLANSLDNLSLRLSNLGLREEALMAIQEATTLYQTLAAEQPETFIPKLASAIKNLSNLLAAVGRPEDALTAIKKVVELRQKIAAERPAMFNPHLATALTILSSRLSHLGHQEEALTVIQEAVKLHRTLAAERPVNFQPKLARSLRALASRLSALGRTDEARLTRQEAHGLISSLSIVSGAPMDALSM